MVPYMTQQPRIVIRPAGWRNACQLAGLDTDAAVAARLGLSQSTIMRATSGESDPGARFIAAALIAFGPDKFNDVFRVERVGGNDGSM